jgi:dipeptidyl aminopeptidase/acylaminoacyl peptidase
MKRPTISCVFLLLSLASPAFAHAQASPPKTPITHETLWMMKRVGAPAVSPNGKWVVYPVTEPSYDKDRSVTDLWLVSADGRTAPRRITNTRAAEADVAWAPDSGSIAFATEREGDEVGQVYVLNLVEGGEARRLTNVSSGAAAPRWRPDGKAILFETRVYPGALDDAANKKIAAEHRDRKYNVRTYEHYPVRLWNEWFDERQPTIMTQALDQTSARDILSGSALAHQAGFYGSDSGDGVTLSPQWSPDGREIVFIATTQRWDAAAGRVGHHLYRTASDGAGEPALITPNPGDYANEKFSADGKALYFTFAVQDEEVYHLQRLYKTPWPTGGDAKLVARDFDRDVSQYVLTADSKDAFLLAPEAGKENLYRVDAGGGKPTLVVEPATGGYTALDIPQKSPQVLLIGSYGSSVSPGEVVRIDPARRTHANLTHVDTAAAAEIDWQPPQHFYFTSAKGRSIHNMIVLPPAFDPAKKYPLLVFIHGGAASNNADQINLRWNYHLLAAPGYVVLLTDYTGSTAFGEKFAQAIKLDPVRTPGDEINQAVDEALKRYPFIDADRMCAAGASYGGILTNWLEATTTRYRCLISHAGWVDLTTEWGIADGAYDDEVANGGPPWANGPVWRDRSPITYAADWKTPMLLSVGERDYRVPIGNTLEAWATLQRMHVPSRLLVWPDAWHWIVKPEDSRRFYEEVRRWLGIYLKGDKPEGAAAVSTQ